MAYFASPGSVLAGLESAIAYYNQAETVDGKWVAFIVDESGRVVAHSDSAMIGIGLQELFGTNSITASEEGNWVITESMRMWVVESDGFLFGSGWHYDESGT